MRIQISYDLLDHNYAAGEKDAFWQEIEAILAKKKETIIRNFNLLVFS